MRLALPALLTTALLTACANAPTDEEVAETKVHLDAFLKAAAHARLGAELLGLMPEYTCGEPTTSFVSRAVPELEAKAGCVTVTRGTSDATEVVTAAFAAEGCTIGGTKLGGRVVFRYTGGEDLMEVEADFREATVDGEPLRGKAGYGTCADETRYWSRAEGTLTESRTFALDGRVAARAGLPVIGGTTLLLDGTGGVTQDAKTDALTFTALAYDVGDYLPHEGTLKVETSGGRVVTATFSKTLWKLGEVEVTVDGSDPVTVPVVQ